MNRGERRSREEEDTAGWDEGAKTFESWEESANARQSKSGGDVERATCWFV